MFLFCNLNEQRSGVGKGPRVASALSSTCPIQSTYLIHITTDQQQLSIEVEDKYTGDIWHSIFSSSGIEELTMKAKNPKKYAVFTKMLVTALQRASDSITVEILSYREMSNKFGKTGLQPKSISPEQAAKRFILLPYIG